MNAHTQIKGKISQSLHKAAEISANCLRNERIRARAEEIVNKTNPPLTGSAHPLHNMAAFAERCAYRANRDRLLKMAITELRCLDYALEYWQADYDQAVAELSGKPISEAQTFQDARWLATAGVR